jgi:PTH1 family peptidyl-tRNA hydrolase
MFLIAGLGNPGEEYALTRHNLGFMVVEELAGQLQVKTLGKNRKCNALVAEADYQGRHLVLAQPQTFMNQSGEAVRMLLHWYKINPANLILIYDDLDLELGRIRVRAGGNSGGHHGVDSVIQQLKTGEFCRVRIGIGKPVSKTSGVDYVLEPIPLSERPQLDQGVLQASQAVLAVVGQGIEQAMNAYNA